VGEERGEARAQVPFSKPIFRPEAGTLSIADGHARDQAVQWHQLHQAAPVRATPQDVPSSDRTTDGVPRPASPR
jgi:hypothetical protein